MANIVKQLKWLVFVAAFLPFSAQAECIRPTVVELFTSQGCPTCPPADKLLEELSHVKGLIALSHHVHYMDTIEWKDPYAVQDTVSRQAGYNAHFKKTYNYTPQMVIDGRFEMPGNRPKKVRDAIDAAKADAACVPIDIRYDDHMFYVEVEGSKELKSGEIWKIEYLDAKPTDIKGGVNKNKRVIDANIVRIATKLGDWQGAAQSLRTASGMVPTADHIAIILQEKDFGRIYGAAMITPPAAAKAVKPRAPSTPKVTAK